MLRRHSSPAKEFLDRWDVSGGDYCVYCLCENGKRVRYIGITRQSVDRRLAQHIADQRRDKNIYKYNWIRDCEKRKVQITIHVVRAGLTEKQAGMIEELLIRLLKKPFQLTNTHAGGSTGYAGLSEESKSKHRLNTKCGWDIAAKKWQDAIDMERGYCVLEWWEPIGDAGLAIRVYPSSGAGGAMACSPPPPGGGSYSSQ